MARARVKEDEEGEEEEDCGSRGASQNEVWRRKKRDESKSSTLTSNNAHAPLRVMTCQNK